MRSNYLGAPPSGTINKFGHNGIETIGSDLITITQSKAMGNGVLVKDSHDVNIGQACNMSSSQGCNEFTYDDEFGLHLLNSYNVVIQYNLTDTNDTGGILLDGAGTYNVQLFNGHASGAGNMCPNTGGVKQPSGLVVDYVSGFAIINGAHDILVRGWTIKGNSRFSIENGGNGLFLNPCTGFFEPLHGPHLPGGGPKLDVNGNCYFNQFGFNPVPTENCGPS